MNEARIVAASSMFCKLDSSRKTIYAGMNFGIIRGFGPWQVVPTSFVGIPPVWLQSLCKSTADVLVLCCVLDSNKAPIFYLLEEGVLLKRGHGPRS